MKNYTSLEPVIDHKTNIKYWIEALANPDISSSNKALINKVLENELRNYIEPVEYTLKSIKIRPDNDTGVMDDLTQILTDTKWKI